jgi:type III restriction enzyme
MGSTLVRMGEVRCYTNALHEGYDGLNSLEERFADALETWLVWARNSSQTGYKISLVDLGQTVWFFPNFMVWAGDKALRDIKGEQRIGADAPSESYRPIGRTS